MNRAIRHRQKERRGIDEKAARQALKDKKSELLRKEEQEDADWQPEIHKDPMLMSH